MTMWPLRNSTRTDRITHRSLSSDGRQFPPSRLGVTDQSRRGISLTEVITASAISLLVIILIGQVDLTRVYLSNQTRFNANGGTSAALLLGHMQQLLQQADRINLASPTNIQFRRPSTAFGANLDLASSYTWAQYQLVGTQVLFYDDTGGGCGVNQTFDDITALTIVYDDVAIQPPGGDPPVQDNNALGIAVNTRFILNITIREGAYTNVPSGLAPLGVADPPPTC